MEGAWGRADGEASEPAPPAVRFLWNETSGSAELSGSVSLDGRTDCRFGWALLIAKKHFVGAVRNARHRRCRIDVIDALATTYRNYTASRSHFVATISPPSAAQSPGFRVGLGPPKMQARAIGPLQPGTGLGPGRASEGP